MGADCIEPDLVMTKDGELITRHEPEIGATTDVALKFPERKTIKQLDGKPLEGWFAEDFTLAEIKTLRAKQPRAYRASAWDGVYEVPTLQEVIDLVQRAKAATGREVCIYPETKHPTYFTEQGLDIDAALVAVLEAQRPDRGQRARVHPELRDRQPEEAQGHDQCPAGPAHGRLHRPALRPRQGGRQDDLPRPDAARRPGRDRDLRLRHRPLEADDRAGEGRRARARQPLIADAHAAGLKVHPYTFRDEPQFLAKDYANDPAAEYLQFFKLGVDGLFSDFPDTAIRARERFAGS